MSIARNIAIDCDYPGGNIIVESIDGDVVRLRQDVRTTTEWWFYWNFRIRGAAGRTLTFQFTNGNVFSAMGPCFSRDGGATWQWLGTQCITGDSFTHQFPAGLDEAHFAFCVPYVQSHLDAFLAGRPAVGRHVLCTSEHGRSVERLSLESRTGKFLLPVTARIHACESMGDYEIEGIVDYWLSADEPQAQFLRDHVDLQIVPFFDKDGVEEGDQGKLRAPRDHGRDFDAAPLYASTREFIRQLPTWRGRMVMFLDLHCPWIRGDNNDTAFLVGIPQPWQQELDNFGAILDRTQRGAIRHRPQDDIAYGQGWNQPSAMGVVTICAYMRKSFPLKFAATLELAYSSANGVAVTADSARDLGRDIARAMSIYIKDAQ